jgi:hypothetical protein
MKIGRKIIEWTLALWALGEVIYSYQLVGFYYMLRIFNAPLSHLWLPLLIDGLRFVLQSLISLGVLMLVLKNVPPLRLYIRYSIPLAISGFSSAILRLLLPSAVGVRALVEQVLLFAGFILLVVGLLRYYSKNLEGNKKLITYIITPILTVMAFWVLIPIPL